MVEALRRGKKLCWLAVYGRKGRSGWAVAEKSAHLRFGTSAGVEDEVSEVDEGSQNGEPRIRQKKPKFARIRYFYTAPTTSGSSILAAGQQPCRQDHSGGESPFTTEPSDAHRIAWLLSVNSGERSRHRIVLDDISVPRNSRLGSPLLRLVVNKK
jgi:hypothetical protein